MPSLDPLSFRLDDILLRESVEAHFQPILSVKSKSVLLVEGLCRGVDLETGKLIAPALLLGRAREEEKTPRLDRLFRKKVIQTFRRVARSRPELLLALNFEAPLLDMGELGSDDLFELVRDAGLSPNRVALEIVESEVENLHALKQFIDLQKSYGFLIALDDVGAGHSNLNRIAALKPDILKIDRTLMVDLFEDYYKQEIFRALVQLARGIGALVVAEGIEKEEEALGALELGTDMIQGYYFSKPGPLKEALFEDCQERVERTASKFRNRMLGRLNERKALHRRYDALLHRFIEELAQESPKKFDAVLKRLVGSFPEIQCLYVLDEGGIQLTKLHFPEFVQLGREKRFYQAMDRGTDHSMKDYYYYLAAGGLDTTTHLTPSYVSLATGVRCQTLSALFYDIRGRRNILCVDLNVSAGISP